MAGSSEAGRSFRQWARQREVEQADQLKQIECAVARIDELDAERHALTGQVAVALDRLTELGLPADQIRLFIGSDPARASQTGGAGPSREGNRLARRAALRRRRDRRPDGRAEPGRGRRAPA